MYKIHDINASKCMLSKSIEEEIQLCENRVDIARG